MPLLFYSIFNENHELSNLWVSYMKVDKSTYFKFSFFGTFLFCSGLIINNFLFPQIKHEELLKKLRYKLETINSNFGFYLVLTGIIFYIITPFLPFVLKNIGTNLKYLFYIGILSNLISRNRVGLTMFIFFAFTMFNIVVSATYGEFLHFLIIIIFIIMIGKHFSLVKKFIFILVCSVLILFIQSVKHEYRQEVWSGLERSSSVNTFNNLVLDRIISPNTLLSEENVFSTFHRLNHGETISRIIDYVPYYTDFAYGKTYFISFLSSFIPRFLWPGKPETGGAAMVCQYLGDCDSFDFNGHSYNVGLLGESYINFGLYGGAIFMFILGLFFSFIYKLTIKISYKFPLLILSFPVLYVDFVFSIETDFYTAFNSFLKSLIFIMLIYIFLSRILKFKI
jgi:hypothetical protein